MRKRILPETIRGKIMLYTAAITVSLAAVTVAVCFRVFQSFLRQNQLQSAEYNLQVISGNVATDLESILYFAQWCGISQDIGSYLEAFQEQEQMPSISSSGSAQRSVALNAYDVLKEKYYSTRAYDLVSRVLVSPDNCRNYLQISNTSGDGYMTAQRLRDASFFDALYRGDGCQWIGLQTDPVSPGTDLILPVVRPIYAPYGTRAIGWSYLAISDRLLLDYLEPIPMDEDASLYITIGGHSYLFQDGALKEQTPSYQILSDLSGETFASQSQAYRVRLADGSIRYVVSSPLGNRGWTISCILSETSYQAQRRVYLLLIAGIVLFITAMGVLLYILLSRMINRPVGRLKGRIASIAAGDFSRDPSIESEDEFGIIGRGINQMSADVSSLMERRVTDEKQKKDLEYQILQSQINPHFLYNTLNSIKWMATIQNASGIAEMTTSLARLMKSVAKGTQARIPLKQELDLVKDYFLIQQYRYGGSISIEYRIASEDLLGCLVHRFTLQPIVENALFHGIEPKGCAGKIVISAREERREASGRLLVLSVSDNGVGMTQETIRRVLEGSAQASADFFRQLGIHNVNQRIQYEYGPSYGITIDSVPGEYTTMIITLPYVTAEGELQ